METRRHEDKTMEFRRQENKETRRQDNSNVLYSCIPVFSYSKKSNVSYSRILVFPYSCILVFYKYNNNKKNNN